MIKRTIYEFDLRVTDEGDETEYESLIKAIQSLEPNGDIRGERMTDGVFQVTVEKVFAS